MQTANVSLNASEAARQLGVSAKALRLYEEHGLLSPARTASGWRVYRAGDLAIAREVVALRRLGLSVKQVAHLVGGEPRELEAALTEHQASVESQIGQLARIAGTVREMRTQLARTGDTAEPALGFDLPWPWGGERFELPRIAGLTYIVGPLGCGKTRLAMRIAETLPGATFLGLDRSAPKGAANRARICPVLTALANAGARMSDALLALVAGLDRPAPAAIVVDMVEQGLDHASQTAVIAWLRQRGPSAGPLFLLTRSSAILDFDLIGPREAIILCPANHSPPALVSPHPGAPGFEALASCLASPEVRARTEGLFACMPGRVKAN